MKKSKILAVALSALTFSTAAAVTGTVAWYFAQRTVSVSMENITSFNPESGLKVSLTKGIGTTVGHASTTSASTPATVSHGLIRDGSVDLLGKKAYATILNNKGDGILSYRELNIDAENDMKGGYKKDGESTQKAYYYATSYTATFELSNKESGKTFAVYYDNSQLSVEGASFVQESLRIGFIFDKGTADTQDDSFFVIAPFRQENGGEYIKSTNVNADHGDYESMGPLVEDHTNRVIYGYKTEYVKNGDLKQDGSHEEFITDDKGDHVNIPDFDTTDYSSNNLFVDVLREVPNSDPIEYEAKSTQAYIPTPTGNPEDNLAGMDVVHAGHEADKLGYLGNLVANAAANQDGLKIQVKVYTWFEGTDPSSLSELVFDNQSVNVGLKFNMAEVIA